MEEENQITRIWNLYEIGKEYNNMHGLYSEARENYNFYNGN